MPAAPRSQERGPELTPPQSLWKNQPRRHLDSRLPASGTGREYVSVVRSHLVVIIWKTNSDGVRSARKDNTVGAELEPTLETGKRRNCNAGNAVTGRPTAGHVPERGTETERCKQRMRRRWGSGGTKRMMGFLGERSEEEIAQSAMNEVTPAFKGGTKI